MLGGLELLDGCLVGVDEGLEVGEPGRFHEHLGARDPVAAAHLSEGRVVDGLGLLGLPMVAPLQAALEHFFRAIVELVGPFVKPVDVNVHPGRGVVDVLDEGLVPKLQLPRAYPVPGRGVYLPSAKSAGQVSRHATLSQQTGHVKSRQVTSSHVKSRQVTSSQQTRHDNSATRKYTPPFS